MKESRNCPCPCTTLGCTTKEKFVVLFVPQSQKFYLANRNRTENAVIYIQKYTESECKHQRWWSQYCMTNIFGPLRKFSYNSVWVLPMSCVGAAPFAAVISRLLCMPHWSHALMHNIESGAYRHSVKGTFWCTSVHKDKMSSVSMCGSSVWAS